ncbi:Uncharacterised protein [Mycobacteroides abscessus subsp. massiliense]|nr:Uncharacterised protein [Mycobacteroides abscessus subsp. massiliense]
MGGFHGQGGAHISGQVQITEGSLAVAAFERRREGGVGPQVDGGDDVFVVGLEFFHQVGVIAVHLGAERFVALGQDRHEVVGAAVAEVLAHVGQRLHRGRLVGQEGQRVSFDHLFQLRPSGIEPARQQHPQDDDGYG